MDDPSIAPVAHHDALSSLQKINRLSRTACELLPHILELSRSTGRQRLCLLDVACGGADVPIELARLCARHQVTLNLTLVDRSETALAHAAARASNVSLTTLCCDAFSDALPEADIVTNSLFLHHLDAPDVIRGLAHFASRACHLLLVSDLCRSRRGLAVAWTTCHLLSRSPIVHHDGPASVRAAWTVSELRSFADDAGLPTASITSVWPWRMLLKWRREG